MYTFFTVPGCISKVSWRPLATKLAISTFHVAYINVMKFQGLFLIHGKPRVKLEEDIGNEGSH